MGIYDADKMREREARINRVIEFDPSEVYERIEKSEYRIDKFARNQSIPVFVMFPPKHGKCSCGCGKELKGRQTRWASEECSNFANAVRNIICGYMQTIEFYLYKKLKTSGCVKCGSRINVETDHKIAVVNGGAGMWLDNYQPLCKKCHIEKTQLDLRRRKFRREGVEQLTIF